MIFRTSSSEKPSSSFDEVERLGEALAVRPVGAEEDALDADEVGERAQVLLVVRRDPHVPRGSCRAGRPGTTHGVWFACFLQPLHEQVHPVGAVLDARDAQRRVAV